MGPRIKVLHVLPDLRIGGGQMVVLDAIGASDRSAFEYHVASVGSADELSDRFRALGVYPVDCTRTTAVGTLWALVRTIRAIGADVIHVHSPVDRKFGHAAAFLTGRPAVSHLHSPWDHRASHAPDGARWPVAVVKQVKAGGRNWFEHRVVREYLAVSAGVEGFFVERGLRPLTLVENGIESARFSSDPATVASAREAIGIEQGQVVMSVARLDEGKGHFDLATALAASDHLDWKLVLVGDGPLADDIRARADALGVGPRLVMLGSRDDVPLLLPGADVWVLASKTEGLPISVMEAMAAGRAICVYELPTLVEMLADGEAGVIVKPDPAALTVAIDALLHDPDRRAVLGRAAETRVADRYGADTMAVAIEAAYRRALS